MNQSSSGENGFNRRQFIKGGIAGSAMLATGVPMAAEDTGASNARAAHAALHSLAPGAIEPQGWVRAHLQEQAKMSAALGDIAYPFNYPYWEGMEDAKDWFQWEQRAYWIDGNIRLAILLNDPAVMTKSLAAANYTLEHADAKGLLGPDSLLFGAGREGPNRWPHTVLFRAYMALGDAQPTPQGARSDIAEIMRRHYLNDDEATYSNGGRNITNLEPLLWCYERTGDPRLLQMAEKWWTDFLQGASEAEAKIEQRGGKVFFHAYSDLAPSRVFSDTAAQAHGVSYAEQSKLPAILYLYTGKDEYLKYAVAAQKRILNFHMLIDGIPSSSEGLAGTTALDQHETCDISDYPWSWSYLLMATGDGVWGDHIERACFNAHPGSTRDDWKGIQYYSSPNQFLATLDCDQNHTRPGTRRMAFQPNPAQYIGCCAGNKHRCFPNYALNMWMKTKDNGLAATLYGPSKITASVGAHHQPIEIVQKTNYPFEEEIQFEISSHQPVSFPLSLRIPAWCDAPTVHVNGSVVTTPPRRNGFIVLDRQFKSGDTVTLHLPMKLAVTNWPNNGIGIERGPLVYALAIKPEWSSLAEAGYSSPEFPTWEATPVSEWRYGLAIDPTHLDTQVEVKKGPAPAELAQSPFPWASSPVTLSVPARRIEGWELTQGPDNPKQKFTPPLPEGDNLRAGGTVERITLVPYGAAKLRLSVFPKVNS